MPMSPRPVTSIAQVSTIENALSAATCGIVAGAAVTGIVSVDAMADAMATNTAPTMPRKLLLPFTSDSPLLPAASLLFEG